MIIGISGKAETGKDYLQQTVLQQIGFRPWSLAWHFKVWLVGQGKWSHEDVFVTKPPECRSDLQDEGTKRGRLVHGEDIWCNVAMEWLKLIAEQWGERRFVVPDVRFKNELAAIQRVGGKVIRMDAPKRAANSRLSAEQRAHVSETDLDDVLSSVPWADGTHQPAFNAIVQNDPGDDPLGPQVERIFDRFGWHDLADELRNSKQFSSDPATWVA